MKIPSIKLVDSIVLTLSTGPYTLSKYSPIYSRALDILEAGEEQDLQDLLSLEYDTIYEAYDYNGSLLIREITEERTKDILKYYTHSSIQPDAIDNHSTLLGRFISMEELLDFYPEYFI